LEHPEIRHDVVYGVSESPNPLFHNRRARVLGYRPQDNAEDNLAPGYLPYEDMDPACSGRDYVGGAYAGTRLASLLDAQS
jgi:uronate dehydrogenase